MSLPARWALLGSLLGLAVLAPTLARADEPAVARVYAQIVVDSSAVRTGPGVSFNRVYVAHRGEVLPVQERSTLGYWFRVQLPDGTSGWILGDTVYTREPATGDHGCDFFCEVFAPPPLPTASGEIAVTFGALGTGGFMAVRPTWLLAPTFGIEADLLASVSPNGQLLVGGGGPVVNLFPSSAVVPFVTVGGGIAYSAPNADTFILTSGTTSALWGGLGLRIGFRYRITLRLEGRMYAFYTPDRYVVTQELSAGLTVFF